MAFAPTKYTANFLGTGVDLLQLPASPGFRQIDWTPMDATVSNTSPYTRQEQVQMWAGGERWAGTLTLPTLSRAEAAAWTATLLALRGTLHAFQVQDQVYPGMQNPQAAMGAVPTVDATGATGVTNAPGTTTLATRGWTPNGEGLLTLGDYLQVGYRLHRVVGPVNADANGRAAIPIWPSLRETPTGALDLTQATGIFRRADSQLSWSTNYDGTSSLSFKIVEVR